MTTRKYQYRKELETLKESPYALEVIREYVLVWGRDEWLEEYIQKNESQLEEAVREGLE